MRYLVPLLLLTSAFAQDTAMPTHNLVTFFNKCRAGTPVTVAYIGGSVTSGEWRPFTTAWLKQQFPKTPITEVNAAIGGTGSSLGVFRFDKHVLQHDPDLVFIEFAINDRESRDDLIHGTMEGLVRQAWKREKKPDLCFVYVTHHDLKCPFNRHDDVANYYGVPTVDMQKVVNAVVDTGLVDWNILAPDNVHPNAWGHGIYAATLATFLKRQMALTEAVPPPDRLPPPKFTDLYETARLVPVTDLAPADWQKLPPEGMFADGSILATKPGQFVEIKFTGRQVGLYYELRQNGGFVSCEVDRKAGPQIDMSWGPTYKFNRQTSCTVADGLAPGEHTLKLTIIDKRHELSQGHEFRLGYLMLAG